MPNVLINDATMTEIANAIREKTGEKDLMYPADMPKKISGIQNGDGWDAVSGIIQGSIKQLTIPDGVTSIRTRAFSNMYSLADVTFPDSLTNISTYAFYDDSALQKLMFPENLNTIAAHAFSLCSRITEITFRSKPKTLESTSFYSCTGVTVINAPWSEGEVANAPWGATKATINYNYDPEADT